MLEWGYWFFLVGVEVVLELSWPGPENNMGELFSDPRD